MQAAQPYNNPYLYPNRPLSRPDSLFAQFRNYRPMETVTSPFIPQTLASSPTVSPSASKQAPSSYTKTAKQLAMAGGLFLIALLTHRLPGQATAGSRFLLTPDWKVWSRVFLGVAAAQKINQAFNWKPPPWLNAMETVAVLHPLMVGFSRQYPLEVGVMAPMIAGVVSLANWVSQKTAQPVEEQTGIPKPLTKILISLGFTFVSMALFPKAINRIARTGMLGKVAKETALQGKNVVLGAVAIGANCGCGNVICITQMGELFGGMGSWFKTHFASQQDGERR